MQQYYPYLLTAVLLCLAAGLLFALIRAIRGPRLADRTDLDRDLIIISSCMPLEGCVEAERQAIADYGPFRRCYETPIGSTIGSHCGPGTIGVVVARKSNKKA